MNLKYMMLKDRYIFSPGPQLTLCSPDEDARRASEISLFIRELVLYGTTLKSLTNTNPPKNIRNELLNIAVICAEDSVFFNSIKTDRQLPIKKISDFITKSKTFVEKWQYHIIAYFLLLSNKNYSRLKGYLNIKNIKRDDETTDIVPVQPSDEPKSIYTGVVLKVANNTVYIITAQGEFLKLKPEDGLELSTGQVCKGTIKKDFNYYKYPIILGSACLVVILLFLSHLYMKPSRTILIDAKASVKIKTNSFNRTVEVKALNVSGTKIIKPLVLFNRSLDDSIYSILKEGREKNIIVKDTKITVFITGSAKEAPELTKVSSYITEHSLQVSINNNGIEHKIKKPEN